MDRIKCNVCKAESVNLPKTKLVCIECYRKLQAENKGLEEGDAICSWQWITTAKYLPKKIYEEIKAERALKAQPEENHSTNSFNPNDYPLKRETK